MKLLQIFILVFIVETASNAWIGRFNTTIEETKKRIKDNTGTAYKAMHEQMKKVVKFYDEKKSIYKKKIDDIKKKYYNKVEKDIEHNNEGKQGVYDPESAKTEEIIKMLRDMFEKQNNAEESNEKDKPVQEKKEL